MREMEKNNFSIFNVLKSYRLNKLISQKKVLEEIKSKHGKKYSTLETKRKDSKTK